MAKGKKKGAKRPADPNLPRCPFCGRRITVRKVDEGLHHCSHCEKMFQADR